jgi:hypothetical protein
MVRSPQSSQYTAVVNFEGNTFHSNTLKQQTAVKKNDIDQKDLMVHSPTPTPSPKAHLLLQNPGEILNTGGITLGV